MQACIMGWVDGEGGGGMDNGMGHDKRDRITCIAKGVEAWRNGRKHAKEEAL